jgi:ribosomal protein S18 acetylase RimI-like enzyme
VKLAEHIQASIRGVNAAEREEVAAGDFVLYRSRSSDHPYLNYAVPVAEPAGWRGVDELAAAFAAHGLRPRLEFLSECAPGLEDALADEGFEVEARIPVMICPADAWRRVPAPAGVLIARVLEAPDAWPLLKVTRLAFGEAPPTAADVAAYGGHGLLARAHGVPAGAAYRTPVVLGVSELGGIGVLERYRRRGIAAALTAAAAADAVAAGAEVVFLTPGNDGAQRVYARAGFRPAATMVHMLR